MPVNHNPDFTSAKCPKGYFIFIHPGHPKKHTQVHHTQHSQKPEEIMQLPIVQIIRQPPRPSISSTRLRDNSHKQGTQVLAKRHRQKRESRADAPHSIRSLLVEELQLPNEGEHLSTPDDEVLRDLPEYGNGDHLLLLEQVMSLNNVQSDELQDAGGENGEDGYEEADAHSLKLGEAVFVGGEFAGEGDDEAVVEGDPEDDAEGVEDGEGGRGDLEGGVGGDVDVHGFALEDVVVAHLAVDGGEDDAGGPHRKESENGLQLFHLGHGAESPWIHGALCAVCFFFYCCFVEEPAVFAEANKVLLI